MTRPTLQASTQRLIREAASREQLLDDEQFVGLGARFLLWSGLTADVDRAVDEVRSLADEGVRRAANWLRRSLGSAAAVHACDLDAWDVTTAWGERISASEALVDRLLDFGMPALEDRAHALSKDATDDRLRELIGDARYSEIHEEYVRRGGTKPLISFYSRREWSMEVQTFFLPSGRSREALADSLSFLVGRAIYRRGRGRRPARWVDAGR